MWLYAVPQWDSIGRLARVDPAVPLAILSAGQDELIAPHQQPRWHKKCRILHN